MKRVQIDIIFAALLMSPVCLTIFSSGYGIEQLSILFLSVAAGLFCTVVASFYIAWRQFTRRPVSPVVISSTLSVLCIASIAWLHWPLLITYRLSQGSLDDVAARLRAGERVSVPLVAGLFTIKEAGLGRDGIPCLWTTARPDGTGFVQTPPDHVPFNLWSIIHLDQRWQYISED